MDLLGAGRMLIIDFRVQDSGETSSLLLPVQSSARDFNANIQLSTSFRSLVAPTSAFINDLYLHPHHPPTSPCPGHPSALPHPLEPPRRPLLQRSTGMPSPSARSLRRGRRLRGFSLPLLVVFLAFCGDVKEVV